MVNRVHYHIHMCLDADTLEHGIKQVEKTVGCVFEVKRLVSYTQPNSAPDRDVQLDIEIKVCV
jgi:hypothetical protein